MLSITAALATAWITAAPNVAVDGAITLAQGSVHKGAKKAVRSLSLLKPLPPGKDVAWSHAPFEVGQCSLCHERDDPKKPGKVTQSTNELCFGCHEQLKESVTVRKVIHAAAKDDCVGCHNPHNSKYRKLLTQPMPGLCYNCHDKIEEIAGKSTVQHDAVVKGESCANCHNPHGTDVEHLLIQLPYDLCVNCHSEDGMKDDRDRPMTNIKKLLDENEVWHGPVAAKDCSACHTPHGGKNFRLLVEPYPAQFYAPYDAKNYALCYRCHNDKIMAYPRTTTLTKFRDGNRSLHYIHVHRETRGRTCRACHEVHASKKPHQIRDGVPYGRSGWKLPINYTQNEDGGVCEKTCHTTRKYINKSGAAKKK